MIKLDKNPEYLNNHLKSILDKFINYEIDIRECPHCKSTKFIKHGKSTRGQRYLCNSCKCTFSSRTNRTLFRTKLSAEKWEQFLGVMLTGATLKVCAHTVGINIKTAFYWRHKVLEAIRKSNENTSLRGIVSMTNLQTLESFKGDRKHVYTEPRKNIFNVLAVDSNDSVGAASISKSIWNINNFNKKIYNRIDASAYLLAYNHRNLTTIAMKHNCQQYREFPSANNNIVIAYKKICEYFFKKFRGVATKYLTNYFYYFSIFILDKAYDSINLLYSISKILIRKECKDFREFQFM